MIDHQAVLRSASAAEEWTHKQPGATGRERTAIAYIRSLCENMRELSEFLSAIDGFACLEAKRQGGEPCGRCVDCLRLEVQQKRSSIAQLEREVADLGGDLDRLTSALPDTYYPEAPFDLRVARLVSDWHREAHGLEQLREQQREVPVLQQQIDFWKEEARRLAASIEPMQRAFAATADFISAVIKPTTADDPATQQMLHSRIDIAGEAALEALDTSR